MLISSLSGRRHGGISAGERKDRKRIKGRNGRKGREGDDDEEARRREVKRTRVTWRGEWKERERMKLGKAGEGGALRPD